MINYWHVPADYTHGIDKVIEKALMMGYRPNEIHSLRELYVFGIAYYARNVPKPHDMKGFVEWRTRRNYEAKALCDIAITRTVDEWNMKKDVHAAKDREYDDS